MTGNAKNIANSAQDFEVLKKKIKDFSDVLQKIEHADAKTRILWKEIYENAVMDRQSAHILFVEAYTNMGQHVTEHISLGATLSKYLERMNRANEQLIKLAELIAKSESEFNSLNSDEIFSQMQE